MRLLASSIALGLLAGCQVLPQGDVLSEPAEEQLAAVVIDADFPVSDKQRIVDELTMQRDRIRARLALPDADELVHIRLFESPQTFQRYIDEHYPHFPARRAFFVETDGQLTVYAHWGDRVAEDLRHEAAHGFVHAAVPNVPLWLDEGIAEYFEVPPTEGGVNRTLLDELSHQIEAGQWQPSLARMEALDSPGDMTQLDYAEAWAWVHFLLETEPERATLLQDYLLALPGQGKAPPLATAIQKHLSQPEATLKEYVTELVGSK